MGSNENTKLCDFTSHNNSDFICTPIAPHATSAPSYDIKPALLNLVRSILRSRRRCCLTPKQLYRALRHAEVQGSGWRHCQAEAFSFLLERKSQGVATISTQERYRFLE